MIVHELMGVMRADGWFVLMIVCCPQFFMFASSFFFRLLCVALDKGMPQNDVGLWNTFL